MFYVVKKNIVNFMCSLKFKCSSSSFYQLYTQENTANIHLIHKQKKILKQLVKEEK